MDPDVKDDELKEVDSKLAKRKDRDKKKALANRERSRATHQVQLDILTKLITMDADLVNMPWQLRDSIFGSIYIQAGQPRKIQCVGHLESRF